MKSIRKFALIICILISSCNPSSVDNKFLENYIGVWVPIKWEYNPPIIQKMQIVKRNGFFLIAAEYFDNKEIRFLIGKPFKDHILVTISPERRSTLNETLLANPPEMYFDTDLRCILFLNTVYEFSSDKLFEISSVPIDGKRKLKISESK